MYNYMYMYAQNTVELTCFESLVTKNFLSLLMIIACLIFLYTMGSVPLIKNSFQDVFP